MSRASLIQVFLFFFLGLGNSLFAAETSPVKRGAWLQTSGTMPVVAALAVAGGLTLFDEDLRLSMQRHRSSSGDDVAGLLDFYAHPVSLALLSGLLWGEGELSGVETRSQTGRMGVEAVVLAEALTFGIKVAAGRERPANGGNAGQFQPLTLNDRHDSLPSAHTSGAFALASVLRRRTQSLSLAIVAYGLAGGVGLSRIYRDDHWASDVLFGGIIGELAGRYVVSHGEARHLFWGILPYGGEWRAFLSWEW